MFGWRKKRELVREDDFWGRLTSSSEDRGSVDRMRDWWGEKFFSPTGAVVQVCLVGLDEGPHDEAREAWSHLCERYSELIAEYMPEMLREAGEWSGERLERLELSSILISNLDNQELSFVRPMDEAAVSCDFDMVLEVEALRPTGFRLED